MSAREKSLCNVLNEPCNWDETQITPTLTARNAGGCQRMPDKDNFQAVITGQWEGGDGMNGVSAVVRRLTPL